MKGFRAATGEFVGSATRLAQIKPLRVSLDGKDLTEDSDWTHSASTQRLIITTRDYAQGRYLISWH